MKIVVNTTRIFLFTGILAASLGVASFAFAAELDTDADGLPDNLELRLHTNPNQADTDGDGITDGQEVYNGYSPRHREPIKLSSLDSDADGLPDSWEVRLGTDLLAVDSDNDGYTDGDEVTAGYQPTDARPTRAEKLISVDLATQHLEYSFASIALGDFAISSGLVRTPTPVGEFNILAKVPTKHYAGRGFDYPNTKWNLHFTTEVLRYYIHGAYWHNDFGRPKSHGCVNVSYANMERLYNFAQVGTKVVIE